jgi:hypothetical protein
LGSYRPINTVSLYVKDLANFTTREIIQRRGNYTKKKKLYKEIGEKERKKTHKVLGQ